MTDAANDVVGRSWAHELSFLSQQNGDFKGIEEKVSQCKHLVEDVQAWIKANLTARNATEK
jgi:hypothetical protein